MQARIITHDLRVAVVQPDPHVVGIPVLRDIRSGRSITRHRRGAPRNERSYCRFVIIGNSLVTVGAALGIVTVDLVCRDVAVPPEISRDARTAGAVLNGELIAV